MRSKTNDLLGQLYRKKVFLMAFTLLTLSALISYALFYFTNNVVAAPATVPSILIVDDTTGTGGSSNGTVIETYLNSTGLFTTTRVTTATWPTPQDAVNNYDAVIYSAGNRATPLTTTERDWLNSYLNTYYGRLIIEGQCVLASHTGDAIIRTDILKTTRFSSSRTSSSNIRMTNVVHPVTYGMVTTSYSYNASSTTWRGHSSSGSVLGRWSSSTSPYSVLSAWEGSNRRQRLVFMDFNWVNWSSQAQREKLMNNAVKWVSEFAEVQVTSLAPAGVPKGTQKVKMANLKFSTYATAPNNNTNTITSLTVYNDGTADNSIIKLVRLWEANDQGNITGLNPVGQATMDSSGKAIIKGMSLPIKAGTDKYYVVTYDLADQVGENEEKTIRVRIGSGDNFTTREKGRVKIYGSASSGATEIINTSKPDIPLYVKATNLNTGTSIRLNWQAATNWDLVGYHVYRAVDAGSGKGAYTRITPEYITNTYFEDTGLTEFNRYYYKIRSVDSGNNESLDSDIVMVVPNRPPHMPNDLSVVNPGTGAQLNLTWNAAIDPEPADHFNGDKPDLAGYNIYASNLPEGPFLKINPHVIKETSYIHTGLKDNIPYYFKLAAVDRYNSESTLTDYVYATSTDTTAPEIVDSYPKPAQDYVAPNTVIQVKFDDKLDANRDIGQWIKLEQKNLDDSYTEIPGTVSYDVSTNELVFTPATELSTVGNFRVTVKGNEEGCINYSGLTMVDDVRWNFGTLLNPHVDFESNNTLCGYCHSAHSAVGNQILRAPKLLDLCFSCHDGTGSSYDVKGGRYFNGRDYVPMAAGGYDLSMGSTSTHFTDLGNYAYGSPGIIMELNCISCHDPHGSINFRNVRTTINSSPVTLTGAVYGPSYAVKTASGYEVTTYIEGWEDFCGKCHGEYQTYHSVTTITGEENWRHRTNVPLTGGSTDGRWVVSFPSPGLYTTLPTIGAPTGANITNKFLMSGGNLGAGTFNYVITAKNAVGESVYGNVVQVANPQPGGKIKLTWERIENAFKYRIYRYAGTGDPKSLDITQFKLIAEVDDFPLEYTDEGAAADPAFSPPTSSSARVGCITCHKVHGTPAIAENDEPTRLRRYDNDGICQDCHKR